MNDTPIIFCLCIFAGLVVAAPWPRAGADDPPYVEVDFVLEPLPEELGLQDPSSAVAQRIAETLRSEAIRLLSVQVPYIKWVDAAPSGVTRKTGLKFVMTANLDFGNRVYIECVDQGTGQAIPFNPPDVYQAGFIAPNPSKVETDVVDNGTRVLNELVGNRPEVWKSNLIKEIPLTDKVHVRDGERTPILPLLASQLAADYGTILKVKFKSKTGNFEQDGWIDLNAYSEVYEEDDELFGMQRCYVEHYFFPPHNTSAWHEHIRESLNRNNLKRLAVFMEHWERGEGRIDSHY